MNNPFPNMDFMKELGDMDPETKKQAENIWKMLDDMSQNNPDEYKNFIKKNMKEGFESMKEKKKNTKD